MAGKMLCIIFVCHLFSPSLAYSPYSSKYYMSKNEKLSLREKVKSMFHFGYDNYMKHAFPEDELNPIFCKGRGPDYDNP